MGQSKKKKKSNKKTLRLNKKTLSIGLAFICAVIVITASVLTVRTIKKRRADRTVRIAFYGLDEKYVDLLKTMIPQEEGIILKVDVLPQDKLDTSALISNYDMLFTWRGELTSALYDTAENVPQKVLDAMPRTLRDKKCPPIFLDNYEFAYNTEVLKKTSHEIPERFSDYMNFIESAKGVVFSPFFCNGSDDRSFIDLFGALVMAKAGLSAYNKLIEEIKKAATLEDLLYTDLDGKGTSLNSIVEMLKEWPKTGYTHPLWYAGNESDLVFFATSKQLACFSTLLSRHRKISYNVIRNYEASFIPMTYGPENYGLIAPSVTCMLLSDNSNCKRYIANFFTEDAQVDISNQTSLAPVHSFASAFDKQADDVRFWAASCAGGAVPDLYLGAFQRDAEKLHTFCEGLREIVK